MSCLHDNRQGELLFVDEQAPPHPLAPSAADAFYTPPMPGAYPQPIEPNREKYEHKESFGSPSRYSGDPGVSITPAHSVTNHDTAIASNLPLFSRTIDSHDNIVHHPLGGAAYYFKYHLIKYLSDRCPKQEIAVHLGAQPNCSPHIGNITTFAVGFALASALKRMCSRTVRVKFIYVDSAPTPGQQSVLAGATYQKSLKHTGDFRANRKAFEKALGQLSDLSGVPCDFETQSFWRSDPNFTEVLREIISQRQILGPHLSPKSGKLGIRAACPHEGCGMADKHGVNNQYNNLDGRITFLCPNHGEHYVNLNAPSELERLEFNTPLRNLIRATVSGKDAGRSWIMCTGSDYAGFYQEQFTWRLLPSPKEAPIIFYAPQILDWSGAKLSKSLYVKKGAYAYLRKAERQYLLDVELMLTLEYALEALYFEVDEWVDKPFKLFRNYTIAYLDKQLAARGMEQRKSST